MKLIGMLDSPYVRRVAITLAALDIPHEREQLSVFRHFDAFREINPIVKAPTLITDDGTLLVESTLITDYLDGEVAPERRLTPADGAARLRVLHLVGFALTAADKAVSIVYEQQLRPQDKQHQPWLERVSGQLHAAFAALEAAAAMRNAASPAPWLVGERMTQADITVAVAWRFTQHLLPGTVDAATYPSLAALSARAEALPIFVGAPL
ncbi:glutathione S-transferase family protein [Robbsia sp. Bb-Pol-6]|uniref:Glutathione S-transferase family protein n=1 Tax=Robbsia betulipollinis TaxID=2981849 RepID=A0ABT3ZN12_9BURK|nr:glutathione S-transferase family protein [Robbsia betulipollinis]MCY0387938.1 glutathione S-transferase family protein [Robbsia betulipollinis]